jgi:AcrR family transcriptional regulator
MRSSQPLAPTRPRDRILVTATKLFWEDGIQPVSINRIVADADVALTKAKVSKWTVQVVM